MSTSTTLGWLILDGTGDELFQTPGLKESLTTLGVYKQSLDTLLEKHRKISPGDQFELPQHVLAKVQALDSASASRKGLAIEFLHDTTGRALQEGHAHGTPSLVDELQESHSRLERFMDELPLAVIVGSPDGDFFYANRYAKQILPGVVEHGYLRTHGEEEPRALLDINTGEPLAPEKYPSVRALAGEYAKGEALIKLHDELKPHRFRFHGIPVFSNDGELMYAMKILEDITAVHDNLEWVHQLEQQLSIIVDYFPGIIYLCDKNMKVVLARGEQLDLIQANPQNLLGKNLSNVVPGSKKEIKKAKEGQETSGRYDYNNLVFDHYFVPIHNRNGELDGLLCVGLNVTRNAEMITSLSQATQEAKEASKIRDIFLANISHEIRTPLHAISGFAQLIGREPLSDNQRKFLGLLLESSKGLRDIISDILDITRYQRSGVQLSYSPTYTQQFVERLRATFLGKANKKSLRFEVTADPNLPPVFMTDPTRFMQVASNLVGNAIKFTDKGSVSVGLKQEGNRLLLHVVDTGKGISAHHLPNLFEPFNSSSIETNDQYGGTGLGLSVVKAVTKAMKGDITVKTAPGKGAAFTVSFPLELPAKEQLQTPWTQAQNLKILQQLKVLVAEDTDVNQLLIGEMFKHLGMQQTMVSNGQEALQALAEGAYDVLIADLRMPVMGGFEMAETIAAHPSVYKVSYIIASSAFASKSARQKAYGMGFNNYLIKPFTMQELQHVLFEAYHYINDLQGKAIDKIKFTLPEEDNLQPYVGFSVASVEEIFKSNIQGKLDYLRAALTLITDVETIAQGALTAQGKVATEPLLREVHKLKPLYHQLNPSGFGTLDKLEQDLKTQAENGGFTAAHLQALVTLCHEAANYLRSELA